MITFKEYLTEVTNFDSETLKKLAGPRRVAVSKESEAHYEHINGNKPRGVGNWMFSHVHPSKFDIDKHGYNIQRNMTYSKAKEAARKVYLNKGHSGDIHLLP